MPDNDIQQLILAEITDLKKKVDKFAEALIEIAKTEERVARLLESDGKKTDWILELQGRVSELEKQRIAATAVSSRVEKGIWIGITSFVSATIAAIIAGFVTWWNG